MNVNQIQKNQPKQLTLKLDEILVDKDGCQVRQGGNDPKHIKDLYADLERRGQLFPISVGKPLPKGHINEGKRPLIDGNHRFKARYQQYRNRKGSPDQGDYFTIKAVEVEVDINKKEQLSSYQLVLNDHPPAKTNTLQDKARVLKEVYLESDGIKIDGETAITFENYHDNPNTNWKMLVKWVQDKEGFPNKKDRAEAVVKHAVSGCPGNKLVNYTTTDAINYFKAKNEWGWYAKNAGDIVDHKTIYLQDNPNDIKNLAGSCFNAKTSNEALHRIYAIVWVKGTSGKENKDIVNARKTSIKKINDLNHSRLLKPDESLIDKVVILPQTRLEVKKDELIVINKNEDGEFVL